MVIDRRHWQIEHWETANPTTGARWPLIIFRLVHQREHVSHLALKPFFRRAEAMGLLSRNWWLTAVEAGFEVSHRQLVTDLSVLRADMAGCE